MSYDERLAARVREALAKRTPKVEERKMFSGLCFMVGGSMCCGVLGPDLIVRVDRDRYEEALARPHARAFDFTGRVSRGIVYVGPAGTRRAASLERWIARSVVFG